MASSAGPSIKKDGLVIYFDANNEKSYQTTLVADILIIGGGGSGSSTYQRHKGGAGGAGGLLFAKDYTITSNTTVTVGAGGTAVPASQETENPLMYGNKGEDSSFDSLVAYGGGAGRYSTLAAEENGAGGSGGGGHYSASGGVETQSATTDTANGIYGFGNNGGSTGSSSFGYGGGGAGTAGRNDTALPVDGRVYGGKWSGGDGKYEVTTTDNISYDFKYTFGDYGEEIDGHRWFAGGGGAGEASAGHSTYGAGGKGGGGKGAYYHQGTSTGSWGTDSAQAEEGMANTGGGGGGARGGVSGAGGSGIVLVRYKGPQKATGGIVTSLYGYTIHAFLENGTFTLGAAIGDLSGNTNSATNSNVTVTNGIMEFNGSTSQILLPTLPEYFTGSVSMEGWFYFTTDNTKDILFGSYSSSPGVNFERSSSNQLRLWWNNGSNNIYSSNNVIPANEWLHIVMIRNKEDGTFDFYVNGELKDSPLVSSSDIATVGQPFRIGRDIRTTYEAMDGKIAEFKLYNTALSADEVYKNFNASRSRYGI